MKFMRCAICLFAAINFIESDAFYSLPGIATNRGGEWVGSEDLYNLSSDLGVIVELVMPPNAAVAIAEDEIYAKILTIFKAVGLTPRIIYTPSYMINAPAGGPTDSSSIPNPTNTPAVPQQPQLQQQQHPQAQPQGEPISLGDPIAMTQSNSSITPSAPIQPMQPSTSKPSIFAQQPKKGPTGPNIEIGRSPLPVFQLLVMMQPIDKGFVAYCAGQLLEGVDIHRIFLQSDISYQAITWQKQELLVVSKEQLVVELGKTVDTIAKSFALSYKANAEKGAKPR